MFACNKGFANLFNFLAEYCFFPVDVNAIQLQVVRVWNNTQWFNGCVSGITGLLTSVFWTEIHICTPNGC